MPTEITEKINFKDPKVEFDCDTFQILPMESDEIEMENQKETKNILKKISNFCSLNKMSKFYEDVNVKGKIRKVKE